MGPPLASGKGRDRVAKIGPEWPRKQNPDLLRGRGFTPLRGAGMIPYGDRRLMYGKADLYLRQSPIFSAHLVGETTRRQGLNLDRGSGILGAQH